MQSTPKNQPKLLAMMAKKSGTNPLKENLSSREFCCVIWARNALPFSLIEDELFRAQFAPCLPVGFGREELSKEMKELSEKVTKLLIQRISSGIVTMAVDGWTNCRHKKVLNIMLIFEGEAYFLQSLEVGANTAEVIFQAVKKMKTMLEEHRVVVCSVVGDNASGVQSGLAKYALTSLLVSTFFFNVTGWNKKMAHAGQ